MKKSLLLFILSISILTSCTTDRVVGKSSNKESKQFDKIEEVQKAQNKNVQSKMNQVAVLASGTDYALNKVTNKEPATEVAQDINKRVMSLVGKPNLDSEKEIWRMVDGLASQLVTEKAYGEKLLEKKDKEIAEIQNESKLLISSKDQEIEKYIEMSKDVAMLADARKVELDEYKGWFGLKAVGKGLWQFVTSMAWILGGLTVVYLLLRAFASTNPIVGAVFSIVEQIAAGFIKLIEGLAPKASKFASLVPKKTFDGYKTTLHKLIDTVELLKDTQKRTGKQYTLEEILNEFSKSLNDDDKARVDEAKKDIGWH